jgi:hypothetical protein
MAAPTYPNPISVLDVLIELSPSPSVPAPSTYNTSFDSLSMSLDTGQTGYPKGIQKVIPKNTPSVKGPNLSLDNFHGMVKVKPGNSGILTSGSGYTLPAAAGTKVSAIVIAGGGGGGGGSARNGDWQGYFQGGGGGGSAGAVLALNEPVTLGATLPFSIGSGGGAGGITMGQYTPAGSPGGNGGRTSLYFNGNGRSATEGGAGGVSGDGNHQPGSYPPLAYSQGGYAGAGYPAPMGTSGVAGGTAPNGPTVGGAGGRGYTIDTTVGTPPGSILGLGAAGSSYAQYSSVYPVPGTGYGAGGSGGGTVQSDRGPSQNMNASAGIPGAIFIWWGY